MLLHRESTLTGQQNVMEIKIDALTYYQCWQKWVAGILIQDAFSMLDNDECEFIKSGITPQEWDEFNTELEARYQVALLKGEV
tara:strand:+ start:2259 stop:2507 length:249 start_codon:yes stop_codon:yes gene_type:complete